MDRYLWVNLLGPGPRLMKKEFTGPRSHRGWKTLMYSTMVTFPPSLTSIISLKEWLEYAVVHLVEALRYKPEGRGFDSRCCHWNIPLTESFRPHYGPGVDSASNRNEYQEYFLGCKDGRCVGLIFPPSCADLLEIWERHPRGTLRACPGL